MKIDLNTPTVPLGRKAWRLFPGVKYTFLDEFLQSGVGFLDLPAFELPEFPIEKDELIDNIAYSEDVKREFSNRGKAEALSLDKNTYLKSRRTQNRSRVAQSIINFYHEVKGGDYIVLPYPLSFGKIIIGRATDFIFPFTLDSIYGGISIPARRIDWTLEIQENKISTDLSRSLRNETPISLLENSRFIEVFSLAHGSFVHGERHVSTIYNDKDDFLDTDASLLGTISQISSAICHYIDHPEQYTEELDLLHVLLSQSPIEYSCSQEVDIHSVGFNRYIAATLVPMVISALTGTLIHLSGQDSKAAVAAEMNKIQYVNSGDGADPQCTARVSEASKAALKLMGIDNTWNLCQTMKASKARAGLRPSATPKL